MLYEDVINQTSCAAGVLTNIVLLYCIRKHTQISLGAYKQLLTIFASYDLFLTILHEIVDPKVVINDGLFGINSNSMLDDRVVPSVYCSCFTVPFALMNIHFLYRYWSVSWPNLIPLFSKTPFIVSLASLAIGVFLAWHIICLYGMFGQVYDDSIETLRTEFKLRFGRNKTQGWLVMNWNDPSEVPTLERTLCFFDGIMIISFVCALTLGMLTFRGIRHAMNLSQMKNNLQMKLFIAVTAQTIVPLVCVYIPYFCCLTLTYYRMPVGTIADVSFYLVALFPSWDAVVIIVLMTDYRNAIWYMVTRSKPKPLHVGKATNMTTIAPAPSTISTVA